MIMVLNPEARIYYILPASQLSENFNQEQLETFLKDVLNGKAVVRLRDKLLTFSFLLWRTLEKNGGKGGRQGREGVGKGSGQGERKAERKGKGGKAVVRLRDKLLTFSFLQWRTLEKNGEREGGSDAGREGRGREVRQAGKEEGGGEGRRRRKGRRGEGCGKAEGQTIDL